MKFDLKKEHWIPCFIVGSGRSGSTFLSTLLNGADEIYFPFETSFIAKAYPFYYNKNSYNSLDYKNLTKLFRVTSSVGGWGMSENELINVLEKYHPQSFKEVNNVLYNYFLHKKEILNIKILGLRRPQMIAHISRIKNVYPNSKFIHIIRDGRDVFLSYKDLHTMERKPFGPKSLFSSAIYWSDIISRFHHKNNSMIIRYEDLLQNTNEVLLKIGDFLRIENLPNVLNNYADNEFKRAVTDHQLKGINSKVFKGVDKTNYEKYESRLSFNQKLIFELISGYYLHKNNYELLFRNLYIYFLPISLPIVVIYRLLNNLRYRIRETILFFNVK